MMNAKKIDIGIVGRGGRKVLMDREAREEKASGSLDGRSLRKTGRSAQLMMRTTPSYRKRVEVMAEENGWSFSETMERAVDALDRELKGAKS